MDDAAAEPAAEPVTLAESLVALQAQRAQGAVLVAMEDQRVRIFLADGAPVAVQTNAGEPAGDADTLWESLVACLQWVEPSIAYDPDAGIAPERMGDPCPVEPLIIEAVRRQFDLQELDAAVGPFMAHRPRVLGEVSSIAQRCGLYGADEQDFVVLASRATTVEDLLVEGPLDLLEAYQLLYGLVLLGAISLHDPSEVWDEPAPAAEREPARADLGDPVGAGQGPIDFDDEPIDFDDEPIDFDDESIDASAAFDDVDAVQSEAFADVGDSFDDADDAFDDVPAPSSGLREEVAEAFEPGLADFLLDVVQESDAPPRSQPSAAGTLEDDDAFPPLDPVPDQDDSLPPPPRDPPSRTEGRRPPRAPTPSPPPAAADDDSFPPLDRDDSLPPPPKQASPVPRPSHEDLLRQADEDAKRILAEARAAKERQARARGEAPPTRPAVPTAPAKPPRDASRDEARRRVDPRSASAHAPREPGGERHDPRAPSRRSPPRVIVEERVVPTGRDRRVAVRTSQKPVASSVRPRPVVTRRKVALPSDPNQPAITPPPSDPQPAAAPRSPAPSSPSPRPPSSRTPMPHSPVPHITPPTSRSVTPPHRAVTTPPARSSSPRGSNPSFASDPGPPSHPGRRGAMTPPPLSSPGRSSEPGRPPNPAGPSEAGMATERQKQLAQLHLKKGKRFLYRNNATRALPELEKATELDPESVELRLYALWARFSVEPGSAEQAKKTERELKELAAKAMSDDRKFGFAHFVMGQLALREGRNGDAVRSLGTAVKLDPDNQDAKRGHQIAKRRQTK